ncbi:MAG TPA: polysaccharide deacetylase family protein [Bacillota bacterium]|nr:polysaccharide deacetylase family protein [Bacillota bacterium]
MKIVFVNQRQLWILVVCFFMIVIMIGASANWDKAARKIFGVKAGVKLEDEDVAGLLPEEVTELVKKMAQKVNREPVNASYFPETGEIIPAQSGKAVDIAATVSQVCLAKPGATVKLMISEMPPTISEEYFKPVYHGNKELDRVAFAINVAWGEEHLVDILKTLEQEKVKATFFFVGTWVKAFPELVREIAQSGHEIANHGLYHGHPANMKKDELKKLIADNATLLWEITGKKSVNLFAPPYGELNTLIVTTAGEMGYRTVMWSVDTVDWKNPAPEALLQRVLSKIEPGGIILMHPTMPTRKALPTLIKSLRQKGLEPGTVSSVLQKQGSN